MKNKDFNGKPVEPMGDNQNTVSLRSGFVLDDNERKHMRYLLRIPLQDMHKPPIALLRFHFLQQHNEKLNFTLLMKALLFRFINLQEQQRMELTMRILEQGKPLSNRIAQQLTVNIGFKGRVVLEEFRLLFLKRTGMSVSLALLGYVILQDLFALKPEDQMTFMLVSLRRYQNDLKESFKSSFSDLTAFTQLV